MDVETPRTVCLELEREGAAKGLDVAFISSLVQKLGKLEQLLPYSAE